MSHKCKNDFSSVVLSILSPEDILEMSKGEVKRDDTINYKNFHTFLSLPHCVGVHITYNMVSLAMLETADLRQT